MKKLPNIIVKHGDKAKMIGDENLCLFLKKIDLQY